MTAPASLFKLQALCVNNEATFAENASAMGSNTFGTRIPFLNATAELTWPRESDMTVQARKAESRPGYLMTQACSLEFEVYFSASEYLYTLLKDGLGGGASNNDSGSVNTAVSDHSWKTDSGIDTCERGSVYFVGAKLDGRAGGLPVVVDTHNGSDVMTTLTACPGTPTAVRPDALTAALMMYATEEGPTVTKRFLLHHKDTGAAYQMVGCQLDTIKVDLPVSTGGPAKLTLRYRGVAWAQAAASSPATLAAAAAMENPTCDQSPIAGGQFLVQSYGATPNYAIEKPASISLDLAMGLIPVQGPGAVGQGDYSTTYGWVSQGVVPTITYTIPWNATKYSEFITDGSDTLEKAILFNTNVVPEKIVGFFLGRVYPTGQPPTRTESNGLHYMTVVYKGRESDGTTDLDMSAIRFFMSNNNALILI